MIVGGETTKTKGLRENPDRDYEEQFAQLTGLTGKLRALTTQNGAVMCCNDGPMAAFTDAVEMAAAGEDVSKGFIAYSLGTELGTGWVLADGSIPQIPLECYNCIIDLGSLKARKFDAEDIRSCLNVNTLLPGTLQKYTGQSGVFRLACKYLPGREPAVYEEALSRGLFAVSSDRKSVTVPTEPDDKRKENDYLFHPAAKERTLFGRLVKRQECFDLIREGAASREPDLVLKNADSGLAITPLMRQLEEDPVFTVAQFAQAVGALHFACVGLGSVR